MAKSAYPTSVENHGGTLRIWFIYKGSRVAENNQDQVLILNQKLSELAPSMPHAVGMDGY